MRISSTATCKVRATLSEPAKGSGAEIPNRQLESMMISIVDKENYIHILVCDKFTLSDYKEFEENVLNELRSHSPVSLLFDLRKMTGYTIDLAIEEIQFSRVHQQDFRRIAILTDNQWVIWSAWFNRMLTGVQIDVFSDYEEALSWVSL